MPPICRERADRSSIAPATSRDESATARMASLACSATPTPSPASRRASAAASAVVRAVSVLAPAARAASWIASRVEATIRTWRSAPWATSLTRRRDLADGVPASSDVDAICCDALLSTPALSLTSETSPRRLVTMSANATPSASRSPFGVTVIVRSPAAISPACPAISRL